MKKYALLLMATTAMGMDNQNRPQMTRRLSEEWWLNLPRNAKQSPISRPVTPPTALEDANLVLKPEIARLVTPRTSDPSVHAAELNLQAVEVKARVDEKKCENKRRTATLIAVSSIVGAVLSAAVTLSIHFTKCQQ